MLAIRGRTAIALVGAEVAALGDVVRCGQGAVVEEAAQGLLLVERVSNRG